jgi:hypothetical protein
VQPRRKATCHLSDAGRRHGKPAVVALLHAEPAFSELFLHHLLARNIRVEEDLVDQLFNSSEKRLARVLLLPANFGKTGKLEPVIPKISQGGRDRRHYPLPSQLSHEPVPQAGLYPVR